MSTPSEKGYAAVNGLEMYYEVHGKGEPLVIAHGGLGGIFMFDAILDALAAERQVIAIELQGHGRTADIDRPMRYEHMADDIAALIAARGLRKADVMGYSLGAGAAIQAARRHPDRVRKLVAISAPFKRNGWLPDVLAGMEQMGAASAEMMKPSPLYQTYAKNAPRPEDWPKLVTKVSEMLKRDYDWTKEMTAMRVPALIVAADADSLSPVHAAEFFALLGGGQRDAGWDGADRVESQLAIIPGATHYNIAESPMTLAAVLGFLED
jgi:pimeloyl-ACP methyl ester carboxylesterase